jgi:hypothetical protein
MTALAAGLGAAMAGGPDEANAQATEIMLPHPEREIVVDVSRVAFETQAEILEKLGACLEEGRDFADANGDGEIKGAGETGDLEWAQAECYESAERQFSIADSEAGITASEARIADAKARVDAVGDAIIEDLQGGS